MVEEISSVTEAAEFKERATQILANFCKEWEHSFYNDKIYFNEGKFEVNQKREHTLKVIAVNVSTLKKTIIVITGRLGDVLTERHVYTISFSVDGDNLVNFRKGDFNPLVLRNDFHSFYTDILNYPEVDKHAYGLYLVFDEDATILSARMVYTVYKDNNACRADQFVYHANDIDVLRGYNLVRSGVKNYRNFKFLWEHTNIRGIMNESKFFNAYKLYVTDIERYHSLLQMERI